MYASLIRQNQNTTNSRAMAYEEHSNGHALQPPAFAQTKVSAPIQKKDDLAAFKNSIWFKILRNYYAQSNKEEKAQLIKKMTNLWGKTKAQQVLAMIKQPLAGYKAVGYDYSDRFEKREGELGYEAEDLIDTLGSVESKINQDWDTDGDGTFSPAEVAAYKAFKKKQQKESGKLGDKMDKKFSQADIVFFSGHQYAQYQAPGVFTSDDSEEYADLRKMKKSHGNVKVVVSTSCATICKEAAAVILSKFPNALVLGYKRSAPHDGEAVSAQFSKALAALNRPIILEDAKDIEVVKSIWKKVVKRQPGGYTRQPGWIMGTSGEYWNGKGWKTIKSVSDKANKCKVKGDHSTTF